jgi:hypothetical protein
MTIPAEIPEPGLRHRPTRQFFVLAMVVTLFSLLLQVSCLNYQKVIDDNDLIYSVEQRGCGADPVDCFRHPVFLLYYRPLFTATFALGDIVHPKIAAAVNSFRKMLPASLHSGYQLRADDTAWFHLENMALHAAVCCLAFWFFYLLFGRERPALLAGLIFALHPLQVTVTTFIGGRPDSMALFFLLLFSIGAWNCTQRTAAPVSDVRRFAWLLLSVFAFLCAVFTKEQCLSMLLVLPLLLWRRGYSFPVKNLFWLALYLPPVGLYVWAAKQIIPFASVPNPHWNIPLHLEMIGRTLCYFERLLLLPTVGPIHQSTLGPWDIPQPGTAVAGYLLAIVWLAALWRFRRNPAYRFCALWTTLTLLPCLNLIPIPSQFASCYRAVIPLLGFAGVLGAALDKLVVAWSSHVSRSDRLRSYRDYPGDASADGMQVSGWLRPHIAGGLAVLVIVALYSWETVADVRNWQDNRTLMYAEIYGDPNFIPAYGGLAFSAEKANDWKEVEHEFDLVIGGFMPDVPPSSLFVAAVDSPACQRTLWSHAGLRYRPHTYLAWILPHRGWARQEQGHFAAAAEDYRRAILLNPNDDNSRANLRDCLMANGKVDEAMSLYRSASEVQPRTAPNTDRNAP